MNAEQKLKKEKLLKKIQQFTLMDDDYMTRFFDGEIECVQEVLRILLERKDLKVTAAKGQEGIKNLKGRSVRLDVFARDSKGKPYDIEVQRADKGAGAKRARYNSALMDADELLPGDDTEKLPETYVIFITENDYWGRGKAIYRVVKEFDCTDDLGDKLPFEDGCNIIYVNGAYRGDDAIGRLMHDFCTPNADEMNYSELAEKVRYHKQEEKGVENMCRIVEEYGDERAAEARAEGRAEGEKKGKLSAYFELIKEGLLSISAAASKLGMSEEAIKQQMAAMSQ